MKLVILESPYAAANRRTVEDNVEYAKRCVRDSLGLGEAPLVSHLLYTQVGILDDNNVEQRMLGIQAGHTWYEVAEGCVVYNDYGVSNGMAAGILRANEAGVPVIYRALFRGVH